MITSDRSVRAQGAHAIGGAKDYVSDGKMTGGFAFVAYPAEYRSSGVMTFLVGPRGVVYQKDLGETTEEIAKGRSRSLIAAQDGAGESKV